MATGKLYLVTYTLPNIFRIGSVRFIPGLNYLTEDQWNEIKDHPLLPNRFKEGHLVWVKTKGPNDFVEPNKKVPSGEVADTSVSSELDLAKDILADFTIKEAQKMVANTFDVLLLEVWKDKEDRKGVLSAINDQIEKINAQQSKE